ncbi:MAG: NUDIX domain-containing protein [Oscillospiraceae bacterium]|nr:NUDIX domain-containing protein [Oscillospiraceae bacterium]
MVQDICVPCGDGLVNVRVGAIIRKDGKLLMVHHWGGNYFYSVGGRIQFGETAQEAIVREVREETGLSMEVEGLGFIHETFFQGGTRSKRGLPVYEISFYFYMKLPEQAELHCHSVNEDGLSEQLQWVDPQGNETIYPEFFRTELGNPGEGIKHFVTDDLHDTPIGIRRNPLYKTEGV